MTLLGQFSLWVALLLGVWTAVVSFSGRWRDRPQLADGITGATYAIFAALAVASLALWKGLATHDFNIEYVAAYTSRNLPTGLHLLGVLGRAERLAALLGGGALALRRAGPGADRRALPAAASVRGRRHRGGRRLLRLTMMFAANPFERMAFTPADGRGLNPQLQNPGMVIHPPMLYLGYISLTIPFAFAIAALLSRRLDTGWIHAMRKWTLVSWLFLSIGITLGMWWAYVELGWGGYWAWDPVENASLLPWLTMTAFLHSVMIQEKRGMLKRWNMGLVIGTFLLSIFGTFITRSGVIASVHSFTQSNVGYFFLAFLVICAALSFTLLYTRWPSLEAGGAARVDGEPRGGVPVQQPAAGGHRVLGAVGDAVPDSLRAVRGTKITVGPPFFNRVNVPLGLLLLALTGIGPLIAWRKASPANLRRQFTAPVLAGVTTFVALVAAGVRDFYALGGARARRVRAGRSSRSSTAGCARGGGCTASRCRSRSAGWSAGIAAATAATSSTSGS